MAIRCRGLRMESSGGSASCLVGEGKLALPASTQEYSTKLDLFDGVWSIIRTSANCNQKHATFTLTVEGFDVRGKTSDVGTRENTVLSGTVSESGDLNFNYEGPVGGRVIYSGVLRDKSGGGSFSYPGIRCSGIFTAQRN